MNVKEKLEVMKEIDAANKQHVEDWKKDHQIKGVLIDVAQETATIATIDKELDSYYKVLGCRCIDITRRKIGRKRFEIICDDEGALTPQPKISAVSNAGETMLVGNIFIVGFNGVDDVRSLTDEEAEYVMSRVQKMYTLAYPDGYPMLTGCEY